MNLLEQAMRHKSERELPVAGESPDDSHEQGAAAPRGNFFNLAENKLLVMVGGGVVLAAAGMTLFPSVGSVVSASSSESDPAHHILIDSEQARLIEEQRNITSSVKDWAKAWSDKNIDQYLVAYSPKFKPQDGLSRSAWVKQRKHRLAKYKWIEVTLSNLKVSVENETATAEFIQSFKSNKYSETGLLKRLELKKVNSRWLIVEEISG